jgi:excinuclease UvrABC ATPase subunit
MIPNLWCSRCDGRGYLVADVEWMPYTVAVRCSECDGGNRVMLEDQAAVVRRLSSEIEQLTAELRGEIKRLAAENNRLQAELNLRYCLHCGGPLHSRRGK